MGSFQWDEHFVTGLPEVDKQHHILVDVINQFGDLLTQPDGASFDDIHAVFVQLTTYAQFHFADEESMMSAAGIDSRHEGRHREEHITFLQEVVQMSAGIAPNDLDKAKPLLQFLIYWLAYHILGSDQSMARQIVAIQAGQTAAGAFQAEERARDGAVEPLVRALSGLFKQVSERNRELFQLNQTLEARVAERTQELARANEAAEAIAVTDSLTGLPNRRFALRRLAQAWDESSLENSPLACLMIDADGFKQVNDAHGHAAGDEVLRQLARNLRYSVRNDDVLCRLGGDEFLVISPRTPVDGALWLGEKLRIATEALRVPTGYGEWRGSISIGCAVRTAEMESAEALMKAADEGVYVAKNAGRNRVAMKP